VSLDGKMHPTIDRGQFEVRAIEMVRMVLLDRGAVGRTCVHAKSVRGCGLIEVLSFFLLR